MKIKSIIALLMRGFMEVNYLPSGNILGSRMIVEGRR
jgi:hypothetical protein